MAPVSIDEAKTHLSRLVTAIKSGEESEVIIAQNGVPAARLVPLAQKPKPIWGLEKGKWTVPDSIDELNPEIAKMFYGEDD